MEIISESQNLESKEMLPQILMRIYSICKTDPNFPLRQQVNEIEGEVDSLQAQLKKKADLLEKSNGIYNDLKKRLDDLEQKNYEMKTRLLDELGSEI